MLNKVHLNRNEMPYPPPQKVVKAAKKGLKELNRYPSPEKINLLKMLLAEYSGVSKERIILSPGSDLLLRELLCAFSSGKSIVLPNPSFFPTIQAAKQFGEKLIRVQLTSTDSRINLDFMTKGGTEEYLGVMDNPNNPTGKTLLNDEIVEAVTDSERNLLIVDEAYYEFSKVTFAELVHSHPNLTITRTLDKAFSLAGARIGYLIGGDQFLEKFSGFQTFLPLSSLFAAIEALKDPSYAKKNVKRILTEKKRVKKELKNLGLEVLPTNTNFLLVKPGILDFTEKLKERGVLVLDLSDWWLPGYVRISIGKREENDVLLSKIKEITGQ